MTEIETPVRSASEILTAKRQVKIGNEKVLVRELKWKETLAFINDLAKYATSIFGEDGSVKVTPSSFVGLITQTQDIAESLLTKTVEGKDAQWLGELPNSALLSLLEVAVELNFQVFTDKGKSIAGRFKKASLSQTGGSTPATPAVESEKSMTS